MNPTTRRARALTEKVEAEREAERASAIACVGTLWTYERPGDWPEDCQAQDAEARRLLEEPKAGRVRVGAHIHIVNGPGPAPVEDSQ